LLGNVSRLAQGVPKGPVQIEHARRSRGICDLRNQCKRDRRHARCLDLSCEQSHGPRADRSGRNEEHEVNVRVGQPASDRPSGGEQRFRTSAQAEAKVLVCHPTDDALCLELTQALQRKDEVDIA
jgi:hypothetical protein